MPNWPATCAFWCGSGWLRAIANDEVIDFLVARYGEYVLLTPRATGSNLLLWIAGPVLFLAALAIAGGYLRSRRQNAGPEGLSADEQARLEELMRD